MENVFDGMGLVSKELGQQMERFLQVDYTIAGYHGNIHENLHKEKSL
jgi:hypothetical protein